MVRLAVVCALLRMSLCVLADEPPKKVDEKLRQELAKRVKEDQDARKAFIEWSKTHADTPPDKQPKELIQKTEEIDRANTKWLKDLVEKRGWPRISGAGKDGAFNAWLLVQHADKDPAFQKKCLDLMKALPKEEVELKNIAYLTDRVLVAEGKKQLYGTQFHTVDGKLEPRPIEEEAKVDERRKAMGLGTF